MIDEAQGSWGINYSRFPNCRHFSLHLSAHRLQTCCAPGMWVAYLETTLCPSSSVSSSQSQPGWVCLSTLPSYLCPYWTAKYHNWGRSWAEVNGQLDGPAPCFHLKDSLSVFLKDGPLVGALGSAISSPPLFCLLRKLLRQDETSVHTTCWADASKPFGLSCRYEVAAGVSVFICLQGGKWIFSL